ncbi:MAG: ABC transporter permease [Phycisphaerales bacterium]
MTAITIDRSSKAAPAVALPRQHRSFIGSTLSFARREFRDALASRWFLLYTIAFGTLAIGVSFMSLAGMGSHGFAGFGKTTAGLLNLVMLIVPLMALTAGAGAIAGERERGTLLYLLAQPVSRSEVLLGKFFGLSGALICSLCLGFGFSAVVLAWRSGSADAGSYAMLVGFTCALAVAMLSLGMLISVLSRRAGVASGLGLFVWLALVFLSDLGLMAGALVFKLRVQEVFLLGVMNPLQSFKLGVINNMNASIDVLGPVGVYASQELGAALPWVLAGVIAAWTIIPLILALLIFSRRAPV